MKTTKRQFKLFCSEVKRQCERFGLQEWRLDFFLEDCPGNMAECITSYTNRCARMALSDETNNPMSDEKIMENALHETIELLVMDLYTLALSRFVQDDEIGAVRHTLVRRLEKLL